MPTVERSLLPLQEKKNAITITLTDSQRHPGCRYIAKATVLPSFSDLLTFIRQNPDEFGLNEAQIEKALDNLDTLYDTVYGLLHWGGIISSSGSYTRINNKTAKFNFKKPPIYSKKTGTNYRATRSEIIVQPDSINNLRWKKVGKRNSFSISGCRTPFPTSQIAKFSEKHDVQKPPILIGHKLAIDSMILQIMNDHNEAQNPPNSSL